MNKKRVIFYIIFDVVAALLVWLLFYLYRRITNDFVLAGGGLEYYFVPNYSLIPSIISFPIVALFIYYLTGFYNFKVRHSRLIELFSTLVGTFFISLIIYFGMLIDDVVVSCVNSVGVNLNTASKHLLSYISGIGPALAQNIVDYRTNNGAFTSRAQLLKVKRLGEKVYEQAAGFLRIPGAENPLDNSAVHPERYELVSKMAASVNLPLGELVGNKEKIDSIDISSFVDDQVGLPTLNDIIQELAKPGRDPRSGIKVLEFSNEIHSIEDVKPGMELPGIITNITNFGAFVDVGIKQNGLIHVSNMSDKFISDPNVILKLHQHVKVRVLEVDLKRGRIQLKLL